MALFELALAVPASLLPESLLLELPPELLLEPSPPAPLLLALFRLAPDARESFT